MPQFDVYHNPNSETHREIPYLLNVQSDLLDPLATCMVVPLVLIAEMGKPAKRLNPQCEVEDKTVVMSTAELAGIPRSTLGEKVGSLSEQRAEIIAALDLLFTGI
jgi:toxin CcdB